MVVSATSSDCAGRVGRRVQSSDAPTLHARAPFLRAHGSTTRVRQRPDSVLLPAAPRARLRAGPTSKAHNPLRKVMPRSSIRFRAFRTRHLVTPCSDRWSARTKSAGSEARGATATRDKRRRRRRGGLVLDSSRRWDVCAATRSVTRGRCRRRRGRCCCRRFFGVGGLWSPRIGPGVWTLNGFLNVPAARRGRGGRILASSRSRQAHHRHCSRGNDHASDVSHCRSSC